MVKIEQNLQFKMAWKQRYFLVYKLLLTDLKAETTKTEEN